ncbi:MAG: hypothetical protein JKY48_14995 [Flavobacteriales bacterium]|nr:hypothetical protein [Flavobacteriales bacterium]
MRQFELDYKGSLLQQFPDWMDVVRASVYDCGKVFKNVAADLDMSASQLSRRLAANETDTLRFQLYRLDDLLNATEDLRPIYWLIEKYCQDAEARQKQAVNDLVGMMPKLHEIIKQVQSSQ